MIKKSIASLCFSILFLSGAFCQKFLVLEKTNTPKTTRFYVGQAITFKLDGVSGWFDRQITDILPDQKIIMLDGEAVPLADITTLKVRKKRIWAIVGSQLITFGSTLALATTIARARHDEADSRLFLVSAASVVGGFWLVKPRKIKLGNRHRLRLIDLTLEPPPPSKA